MAFVRVSRGFTEYSQNTNVALQKVFLIICGQQLVLMSSPTSLLAAWFSPNLKYLRILMEFEKEEFQGQGNISLHGWDTVPEDKLA